MSAALGGAVSTMAKSFSVAREQMSTSVDQSSRMMDHLSAIMEDCLVMSIQIGKSFETLLFSGRVPRHAISCYAMIFLWVRFIS